MSSSSRSSKKSLAFCLSAGIIYWTASSLFLNINEVWDSPNFFQVYIGSLLLSLIFGYICQKSWIVVGPAIIFSNLLVMIFLSGLSPLLLVAVLLHLGLSIPSAAVAFLGASLADRVHAKR